VEVIKNRKKDNLFKHSTLTTSVSLDITVNDRSNKLKRFKVGIKLLLLFCVLMSSLTLGGIMHATTIGLPLS